MIFTVTNCTCGKNVNKMYIYITLVFVFNISRESILKQLGSTFTIFFLTNFAKHAKCEVSTTFHLYVRLQSESI